MAENAIEVIGLPAIRKTLQGRIVCGYAHTVGLRSDGTVVAVGFHDTALCNVENWTDMVAIAAADYSTVGLRRDGSVVTTGFDQSEISGWSDIVAIAAAPHHTVGLRKDGTVVAAGYNGDGRCNVADWKLFDNLENL